MENKQTAVEWLKIKLLSLFENDDNGFYEKLFEQAKETEKKQIVDAFEVGTESVDFNDEDYFDHMKRFVYDKTGEQYYNETFNP